MQKLLGGISALGGKIPSALSESIENINNAAYRIAAKHGKSILSEGCEEYLQEILQPVIRNLAFDEHNEFRVISEDAAYAGLMGALTAGVFETGNIAHGEITFRNEAQLFAESYYEEIRHYSTDAKKVSSNLGISNEEAQEIKNYLFVNNSKYDEELQDWVRFDADCAIAYSWQRLMVGKDIKPHDCTLILHELYEMEIKKKHKEISHLEAHRIASKKYNYRKEAEKYYAGLKKYNKNR